MGPCVVAVGVFDGVHRGHQQLLERARGHAQRLGQAFVVITFDPHPATVVRPEATPKMIGSLEDRIRLFEQAGADGVLVLPFTPALSEIPAEIAVRRILSEALTVSVIVVGADFHFGRGRDGNVDMLQAEGRRYGFIVDTVDLQTDEVDRLSSTRVREALAAGDVQTAAALLGRPYELTGAVVQGEQRGRALGFPTANLDCPPGRAVPGDGVYAGWLAVGGRHYPAAISVGDNPTFHGATRRVEVYAIDEDGLDLYGRQVAVSFVARLRDMVPYTDPEALIAQMNADVVDARRLLRTNPDVSAPRT